MKGNPVDEWKALILAGRWPLWQGCIFAVAVTAATFLFRLALGVAFGERPLLILFMFPIILSSYMGGMVPGLLSTLFSAAIISFSLVPPTRSFAIAFTHDAVQLSMLVVNGIMVSILSGALHRTRGSAERRAVDFNEAKSSLEMEVQERKRAEEALSSEKALLRCLIDSASDLIFIKDRDGGYIRCNSASERFMGIPESEQIGQTDLDFFDREMADSIRAQDRQVMETGEQVRVEESVTGCNGEVKIFDTVKAPYFNSDGVITGLVGICRDITKRKRIEEELARAVSYNRSLIEASLDPLLTVDREGRITDVNSAAENVTGAPRGELKGSLFSACFTMPERAEEIHRRVFREGLVKDYELEMRNRDGHVTPVLCNASSYRDHRGDIVGMFAAARDISLRKNLEIQLRQAQKLEAIGTLTGGIAHEFNNIMTAVIGYGNLLRLKLSEDATLLPKVNALLGSAERAAVFVRSLLSFSCRQRTDLRCLDLNELLSRESAILREQIGADIEMRLSLDGSPITVVADSGQIVQILANLANNARDAMPSGGAIELTSETVRLDEDFIKTHGFGKPGSYACITFRDTGSGMDDKTRQKAFEPFFTTKEVGKGAGLGLSVCYGIVKQHNGYITCDSEPGKGSTFRVYLPLSAMSPGAKGAVHPGPLPHGRKLILVADDNEDVREVARELLEERGYGVIEAVNGREAVTKFLDHRDDIALIIMDLVMPLMNGRDAYEEISRHAPGTRAIFISGYPANVREWEIKEGDGSIFVAKPFVVEELIKEVRNLID